jgi:hypothetical protein
MVRSICTEAWRGPEDPLPQAISDPDQLTFFSKLQSGEKRRLILGERLIPSVPVPLRVFYGCLLALQRNDPTLAGRWQDVKRHLCFDWRTKRDAMRIDIGDGYFTTYPIELPSPFEESEGYTRVDFDSLLTVSEESGVISEVDEDTLLEAMPDYLPFLPHE